MKDIKDSKSKLISNQDMLNFDHDYHQYRKSRIVSFYHNLMLKRCCNLIMKNNISRVLDYGCGKARLKTFLPNNVSYEGFDLVKELCTIHDPFVKEYDCIFALQVMMLLEKSEILDLVTKFHLHSNWLVVMIPSRNFFKDHILDRLLGLKNNRDNWVNSSPHEIYTLISKKFTYQNKKNFFGLNEITLWKK